MNSTTKLYLPSYAPASEVSEMPIELYVQGQVCVLDIYLKLIDRRTIKVLLGNEHLTIYGKWRNESRMEDDDEFKHVLRLPRQVDKENAWAESTRKLMRVIMPIIA